MPCETTEHEQCKQGGPLMVVLRSCFSSCTCARCSNHSSISVVHVLSRINDKTLRKLERYYRNGLIDL